MIFVDIKFNHYYISNRNMYVMFYSWGNSLFFQIVVQCHASLCIWLHAKLSFGLQVAEEYRLVPDTLYLTVNYIDRYLSGNVMNRQRLQLLGVASMMIAS